MLTSKKNVAFDPAFVAKFKKNKKAWKFFESQPRGTDMCRRTTMSEARSDAAKTARHPDRGFSGRAADRYFEAGK